MSRGIGATQRKILALLQRPLGGLNLGRDMDQLATLLHGHKPTAAQSQSVQRAVASLRARGLVVTTPGAGLRVQITPAGRAWLAHAAALAEVQRQLAGPAADRR